MDGRAFIMNYCVWKKLRPENATWADDWSKTRITIQARTDKEAQSRLHRMFKNAGFSCMSLVALPDGVTIKSVVITDGKTTSDPIALLGVQ
jgi:hypothetical protein